MRIACPNCAVVYDVPDQALVEPRVLRCARCGQEWTSPPLPPPPPPPSPEEVNARPPPRTQTRRIEAPRIDASPFAVMDIPPRPAAARPQLRMEIGPPLVDDGRLGGARAFGAGVFGDRSVGTAAGIVGWVLTAAVLTTVIALVLLRQPQIEALWPPSQRLYALLGLH